MFGKSRDALGYFYALAFEGCFSKAFNHITCKTNYQKFIESSLEALNITSAGVTVELCALSGLLS